MDYCLRFRGVGSGMKARGGGTLVEAVLLPLFQLGIGQPGAALVLLRNIEL